MREFRIDERTEGLTLLKYSGRILKEAPQGLLRKFLRNKNIELNGKKADGSMRLKNGDRVAFFLSEETFEKFCGKAPGEPVLPKKSPFLWENSRILYEDRDCLFYDKPAGLLTQSDASGKVSLNDLLLQHVPPSDAFRPSVVNRLDYNTSGIVICGKTVSGLQTFSEAVRERRIDKIYVCLCHGEFPKEKGFREYSAYLLKDHEKNRSYLSAESAGKGTRIVTEFSMEGYREGISLLLVRLVTGKPHQIRSHLSFLGYPVLGDRKYGKKADGCSRQMLHCYENRMPEELLSGKRIRASLPEDMRGILKKTGLDEVWERGIQED